MVHAPWLLLKNSLNAMYNLCNLFLASKSTTASPSAIPSLMWMLRLTPTERSSVILIHWRGCKDGLDLAIGCKIDSDGWDIVWWGRRMDDFGLGKRMPRWATSYSDWIPTFGLIRPSQHPLRIYCVKFRKMTNWIFIVFHKCIMIIKTLSLFFFFFENVPKYIIHHTTKLH